MAAWRYEFCLLVLKVSLTSERYFQHSKIKFVSPRGHVISSMYPTPPCTLAKVLPETSVRAYFQQIGKASHRTNTFLPSASWESTLYESKGTSDVR